MQEKAQGVSRPCAPGPRGPALQEAMQALRQAPLDTALALQRQFGDVVCLATAPHPVYLLSHPDAVQHVLREQAQNYRKGVLFQAVVALQGQGLLTSEGALWQQQRRLLQPPLQPRQLARQASIMHEEVGALVQGWQGAARTGKPVQVHAWLHRFTFRVMARLGLGLPAVGLDDLGCQLQELGAQLMPYLSLPWLPASGQTPGASPPASVRQAIATYQALARQIIHLRRQRLNDGPAPDLLAALLQAQNHRGSPAEQQTCDEIITFIGAGTETAADALSWMLYLLALHPSVCQRAQAEITSVVGARLPTLTDLPGLSYGRMVLEETLRLYPPAAFIPRQAKAADAVSGFHIPRDSVVLLSPYVTHRHPAFWSTPEAFQPERFCAAQVRPRHRCAFVPFGAGARRCIGQPLALLEMQLAVSALLQTYTFRLASAEPVVPEFAATLRPRGGLWLTVQPRTYLNSTPITRAP